jgi:uncharacterized membrane protein YidH (DUF202 family)
MKKTILGIGFALAPLFAAAVASTESTGDLKTIVDTLKGIVDTIVPILILVAFAVFLYGIIRYILAAGDDEKRKEVKGYIIYGLVGMFVMVAFLGIITLVAKSFEIGVGGEIEAPQVTVPTL